MHESPPEAIAATDSTLELVPVRKALPIIFRYHEEHADPNDITRYGLPGVVGLMTARSKEGEFIISREPEHVSFNPNPPSAEEIVAVADRIASILA